jgi:hypothetical protein
VSARRTDQRTSATGPGGLRCTRECGNVRLLADGRDPFAAVAPGWRFDPAKILRPGDLSLARWTPED